jgi:hypothetical protein
MEPLDIPVQPIIVAFDTAGDIIIQSSFFGEKPLSAEIFSIPAEPRSVVTYGSRSDQNRDEKSQILFHLAGFIRSSTWALVQRRLRKEIQWPCEMFKCPGMHGSNMKEVWWRLMDGAFSGTDVTNHPKYHLMCLKRLLGISEDDKKFDSESQECAEYYIDYCWNEIEILALELMKGVKVIDFVSFRKRPMPLIFHKTWLRWCRRYNLSISRFASVV